MSFDLYCYRSTSVVPSATEAQALIESFNADEEAGRTRDTIADVKEKIVSALMEYDPRLERFQFDYGKMAKAANISEREARARFQHIELNPPEGDLAIQLTVYDDHVFITIPYWYSGSDADRVFSQLSGYLEAIRRSVGFFAYDPQTNVAFDPEQTHFLDHAQYDEVVKDLPKIAAEAAGKPKKRLWRLW
jgi:hypothetical protein